MKKNLFFFFLAFILYGCASHQSSSSNESGKDKLSVDLVKRIYLALSQGNIIVGSKLLQNSRVSPFQNARTSFDNEAIDKIFVLLVSEGENCKYLSAKYILENYRVSLRNTWRGDQMFLCGGFFNKFYNSGLDHAALLRSFNNTITNFLNFGVSISDPQNRDRLKNDLNYSISQINQACSVDSTSEICLLGPNFKKIFQIIR